MQLYCEQVGTGERVLLLLHGLAGNGAVWRPLLNVIRNRWPGRILVPDLRGHGRSPHGTHYTFGHYAADVADLLPAGERVTAVAHSMGAVVALTAANGWYGVSIDTVLGFGVKTGFTEAEKEKAQSLAGSPVRWFDTRSEAADRFMRLSGLKGLVKEDSEAVDAGVCQENGRWRVAADPRTFTPPGPALASLFRVEGTRLRLACGSEDQMVSVAELRRFDPEAVELPGLGHNLHVQAPEALAELMDRLL
ncbi:MAG: hypothetical protein A3I01_20240 [Betaproteobacteria bacterium RIFCSPLOWO2_02_FULL_65_24]|nr:MAG: hypothetical protein A3I01_20240 [Betaproteobacteria bacterium RIFCSPLOWO2_02_FULL_65_24]OGA87347.1 MAG: hypothetical protein A3G27_06760 [Betaproteobacteria bacterium RIFCSPLOWO2_12_FULL_66_14]